MSAKTVKQEGREMSESEIRLAVIGCGGFALFALQQFVQVPGVRLVAMAGTYREAAIAAAKRFGVEDIEEVDALLARPDVDLVYIATPPFLHHEQALRALVAGKHVICEKPLAMSVGQADELVAAARQRNLLLVANMMQRYNPLFDAIKALVDEGVLGELVHGYFENYATDEGLSPEHWFWDRTKSGGIFIEHGVHFFDLFAGWLGAGEVVAAQATTRPGSGVEEQVHATVRYPSGALVNFYHGFHQPGRLDRQELRLVFERGDVTLHEWIPTRFRIHAVANEEQTRRLCELFPGGRLDATAVYGGRQRACRGRFKDFDAYQLLELSGGEEQAKQHRYGDLLRALMADQTAWIRDPRHRRRLTEQNGRESVALAERADRLAHG
jgi:predicted dehydrogenase